MTDEQRALIHRSYYKSESEQIDAIMERSHDTSFVCCWEQEPDEICGYYIAERQPDAYVLHWLAVKWAFKHSGIGGLLAHVAFGGAFCPHDVPLHYSYWPSPENEFFTRKIEATHGATYDPTRKAICTATACAA